MFMWVNHACVCPQRDPIHPALSTQKDRPDEREDLADEGDGLLAEPVRVPHVGEDDLLPGLDARLRGHVELPADGVLAPLHHVGKAVVVEHARGAVCWVGSGWVWGVRGIIQVVIDWSVDIETERCTEGLTVPWPWCAVVV